MGQPRLGARNRRLRRGTASSRGHDEGAEWRANYEAAVQSGRESQKKKAERHLDKHLQKRAEAEAALRAGTGAYQVLGATAKGGALFLAVIRDYLRTSCDASAPEEWRGGRVAIIVDEAILNTPVYAATRRFIRENYFTKAVFSFYRDAFWYQARTTAKTSLLYLYRKPGPSVIQQEPIFYSHIERIGFTRTGRPDESELPAMLDTFREFERLIRSSYIGSVFHEKAAQQELAKISWPGSVRFRWHEPIAEKDSRMDYAFEAARQIRVTLPADHLTLGHLAEVAVREPPEDPLRIYPFATIERATGEVKAKEVLDTQYATSDLRLIKAGDIVVSGIDLVNGSVGFATEQVQDLVVSEEFDPIRVKHEREDDVDPRYLALLLRTPNARELIAGTVTGTSNRTRVEDEEPLLGIPLPNLPPVQTQRALADRVDDALRTRRATSTALRKALSDADRAWPTGAAVDPRIRKERQENEESWLSSRPRKRSRDRK